MKLPQTCDAIVVGGGLVGLLTYKRLLQKGHNVLLVEKSGKIGGSSFEYDPETRKGSLRSSLWAFEQNPSLFDYAPKAPQHEVLTLGKKGLTPFLGFGSQKIQALDFYNSFVEQASDQILGFKSTVFEDLEEKNIFTHTEVTGILLSEEDTPEEEVKLQINGQKTLSCKEVYWTTSAQDLEQTLPSGQYGKFRQKVKKAKGFDCLSVSFTLPAEKISTLKATKYLFAQEDGNPWIGEVLENQTTCYWDSYIDQNQAADHDFIRKQLKALKKFLNKAFPFEEEVWINERITVHKAALSQLSLTEKNGFLKILPHVKFLGSHKKFWPNPFEGKLETDVVSESSEEAMSETPPSPEEPQETLAAEM